MNPREVVPGLELDMRHLEASALSTFRAGIAKLASPPRVLIETVQSQASALQRVVEDHQKTLRRVIEMNPPHVPPLYMGQGMGSLSALKERGDIGSIGELHIPVRNHAVPRLPAQKVARPGRCRDHLSDRAPFPSPREAPEQAAGWLDDNLDDEDRSRLLEQLSRFLRSEEIPSDAREGLRKFLAWWKKLNQSQFTSDQSFEFKLNLQVFLQALLGLSTAPDGHQKLSSGLLVPHSHSPVSIPDLAPEVYTTKQLAKKVHTTMDTLKRHARIASAEGPLPQPLPSFPGCFVVERSDPTGGKGCGWKFQEERKPEGT
jgi:hypothetical protein